MNFKEHIDIHNESFSEILKIAIVQFLLLLFEYLATKQIMKEYIYFFNNISMK